MTIDAQGKDFSELNKLVRQSEKTVTIKNCCGQRFIGSGLSNYDITIDGTPGNALGSYLDNSKITVHGNVQDAVGDTMNNGTICVYGNAGDALGYSMRGGRIFIKGSAGYRTGIHMKEYQEKKPIIVISETVGSFLGEYMAGGILAVLGINTKEELTGNFVGTGMHGGKIFLRTEKEPDKLPIQVLHEKATKEDMSTFLPILKDYCAFFGYSFEELSKSTYYVLKPNAQNPYRALYTNN